MTKTAEAEKKVNVAVVGCGRWGLNHVRTAAGLPDAQLRVVCDRDVSRRTAVAEISPDIPFTTDLETLLVDPQVEAVIVATPAETHYTLSQRFLEAGKHVLVEKPMALTSGEARELTALARQKQRVLMVGHLLLFHPAIRTIKHLIEAGELGRLQYIYSNRLNLGTVRQEENILWSFAPHDISVLQYLIGSDPESVQASGAVFLQPGIHDVTLTTLTYPHNVHAHIHVSWLHPFKEHRLVIIGSKSMVVFEDSRPTDKLIMYPKGIDWVGGEPVKRDEGYQVIPFSQEPPLALEQAHFLACIREGRQPLTDGEHAVRVLEILEEAQRCLENGTPVREKASGKTQEQKPYFVHPTAVVDEQVEIGEGTRIWHFSHIQSGAKIGSHCTLGQNVNVGNNVRIGNYCKIQNNVSVYEGVELEDYVFCGPSMVFTNVLNPRCEYPQRGSDHYVPTRVKYGASIGANATIVAGHTIGRFAFVGAGAVVTKDVPDYALVVGNPARVVGWMCRCGVKLSFSRTGEATCRRCGRRYHKKGTTGTEQPVEG